MTMTKVNAPRTDCRFTPASGFKGNVHVSRYGGVCQVTVLDVSSAASSENVIGTVSPAPPSDGGGIMTTNSLGYGVNTTTGEVVYPKGKQPGQWTTFWYLCDPDASA